MDIRQRHDGSLCFFLMATAMIFGLAMHAGADTEPVPLQAGFAVMPITPPDGFRMSGYFTERVSTGTHDPLLAKAMALEQGGIRVALVFCDIIGVPAEVSAAARRRIAEETGIPESHSVVAATHSHTGPLYSGSLSQYFEALRGDADTITAFKAYLAEQIAEAVKQANAALQPVTIHHGVAAQTDLSFNRRFYMRDGSVRCNPGKMNPGIVRPAGPIDPAVGLIAFTAEAAQQPHAALTVFSLHLDTVGGTEYSADYPGLLQAKLGERFGEGFLSLFGLAPCGDINHVDISHKQAQKGQEEAGRIGATLAATVVNHMPRLQPCARPHLGMAQTRIEIPLQGYTDEELAWARDNIHRLEDAQTPFFDKVRARRILDLAARGGDTIVLEVQALRLDDDLAIVLMPGEVFVELGLGVKYASPFENTLVIELANDNPAYIPTAKAFAEGSYEVENSRIAPGGGERMAEAARRLLYDLKSGK